VVGYGFTHVGLLLGEVGASSYEGCGLFRCWFEVFTHVVFYWYCFELKWFRVARGRLGAAYICRLFKSYVTVLSL
jgi:hypothetical protein